MQEGSSLGPGLGITALGLLEVLIVNISSSLISGQLEMENGGGSLIPELSTEKTSANF